MLVNAKKSCLGGISRDRCQEYSRIVSTTGVGGRRGLDVTGERDGDEASSGRAKNKSLIKEEIAGGTPTHKSAEDTKLYFGK